MVWQTRYLMTPQFQGLYVCHANGYRDTIAGQRVRLTNSYLCSDGSISQEGTSHGVIYPSGGGYWYLDGEPKIRCPIGVGEDVVEIAGERRLIRAVQPSRLQFMTEREAQAEGVVPLYERTKRTGREVWSHLLGFRARWDATAPEGAKWADNPWVWVVMHEPAEVL